MQENHPRVEMEFQHHHHHHQQQQEDDEDEEMPLPINSTYGHNNHIVPLSLHHHHHHHKPPHIDHVSTTIPPPPSSSMEDNKRMMMIKVVKYKECLKNHAASIGGKATDGCGEFMPSGEDGLICSVCNCHRNFHRKEIEGDPHSHSYEYNNYHSTPTHLKRFDLGNGRNLILQKGVVVGAESLGYNNHNHITNNNAGALVPSRVPPQMIMSYNMEMGMGSFPSESDDQDDNGGGGGGGGCGGGGGGYLNRYPPPPPPVPLQQVVKKRFRTKFTQEQKEKMVEFAEKVGWKIQRQEESVVQEFCQEIGIKRRVLKVWMHNNKQNLSKNNNNNNSTMPINPTQTQDPN